jgi:hypothetical protein
MQDRLEGVAEAAAMMKQVLADSVAGAQGGS